jgi:beta-N-acetylhexosaminidase
VQPVGKHAPGHGRALVDSHLALPRVHANDLRPDLLPFGLNTDLPWLMTAHIVYAGWDPILPATVSRAVIGGIIRGRLGFGGMIVSDDLAMQALSGTPAQRAAAALAAGCDVALYCAGDLAPTAALLATCPVLSPQATARLLAARALAARRRRPLDAAALVAERDRLLA